MVAARRGPPVRQSLLEGGLPVVLDHAEHLGSERRVRCLVRVPTQLQAAEVVLELVRLLRMTPDLKLYLARHLLDNGVCACRPCRALGADKQVLLELRLTLRDVTPCGVDIRELLPAVLADVAVGRHAATELQVLLQPCSAFTDKASVYSVPVGERLGAVPAAEIVDRALRADPRVFGEVLTAVVHEPAFLIVSVGDVPRTVLALVDVGRALRADDHVLYVPGLPVGLEEAVGVDVLESLAAMRAGKVVVRALGAHPHVLCKLNPSIMSHIARAVIPDHEGPRVAILASGVVVRALRTDAQVLLELRLAVA
mmetsp:Transcript_15310/g.35831  ORF Transcript_15310/g.35831 Transcript_15310/m.35831 type:complete len:311 (+) Transcript_15310:30-962(+)